MAGNYLTLHTNDRVVVTTSRGNQEKWFDAEKNLWYKVDDGCFEHWQKLFPVKSCVILQMQFSCRESPWQITGPIRPRFMFLLKERIETVLMGQQKKLFEK